jgi:hypothetical protein
VPLSLPDECGFGERSNDGNHNRRRARSRGRRGVSTATSGNFRPGLDSRRDAGSCGRLHGGIDCGHVRSYGCAGVADRNVVLPWNACRRRRFRQACGPYWTAARPDHHSRLRCPFRHIVHLRTRFFHPARPAVPHRHGGGRHATGRLCDDGGVFAGPEPWPLAGDARRLLGAWHAHRRARCLGAQPWGRCRWLALHLRRDGNPGAHRHRPALPGAGIAALPAAARKGRGGEGRSRPDARCQRQGAAWGRRVAGATGKPSPRICASAA